jgi:hypothetical protein
MGDGKWLMANGKEVFLQSMNHRPSAIDHPGLSWMFKIF